MNRIRCRKPTLADIMILVGLTAVGLSGSRVVLKEASGPGWAACLMYGGSPILLAWTLAVVASRLSKPRPSIRRLIRQPGAAAGLAASTMSTVAWITIIGISSYKKNLYQAADNMAFIGISVGAAVLGAWSVLFSTRTARPEPGWIDLSGIAVGAGWIALMFIVLCAAIL